MPRYVGGAAQVLQSQIPLLDLGRLPDDATTVSEDSWRRAGWVSAIKVFNWTATMYKGSVQLDTPMLYAIGFVALFLIGGMTGLFLAALGIDVHVTDTYFVIVHFHYIMVGGTVMAFLGGVHYWWLSPKRHFLSVPSHIL